VIDYLYRSELVEEVVHIDPSGLDVSDGLLEFRRLLLGLGEVGPLPRWGTFDEDGDELEIGVDERVEEALERCFAVCAYTS
jgi:hypothetical protein